MLAISHTTYLSQAEYWVHLVVMFYMQLFTAVGVAQKVCHDHMFT